jgi:hypothetical protein
MCLCSSSENQEGLLFFSAGDDEIRCFSHTHMMGAGVVDYGNIGVMVTTKLNSSVVTKNGYRSRFSHQRETASPGVNNNAPSEVRS